MQTIDKLNITNEIRLEGNSGTDALIEKSAATGRDELKIYAGGDAYAENSRGVGIQLYGLHDRKHGASVAILSGPAGKGDGHLIVSEKGNIIVGTHIWDFADEGLDCNPFYVLTNGVLVAYIDAEGNYVKVGCGFWCKIKGLFRG